MKNTLPHPQKSNEQTKPKTEKKASESKKQKKTKKKLETIDVARTTNESASIKSDQIMGCFKFEEYTVHVCTCTYLGTCKQGDISKGTRKGKGNEISDSTLSQEMKMPKLGVYTYSIYIADTLTQRVICREEIR